MIGTTIGGYQITDKLAEGGMGAVFVARHGVMGRDAVVKLLLPELSHNDDMVRRFFNEARAAASINDPGIVQVFDVGYLPDHRAYIVMERLRGETLAHRLRSRGLHIDQTVHFLRLLARTLDAAHEHRIVHRDLKPDNIFIVPDKDVVGGERTKILDFGIAKLAGIQTRHATQSGAIFGTPAYMAPEQCSDAATVDARADLYAIGCIAYEMLCGQPPFGGGGIELLAAHLRDEPVPLRQRNPNVPPWLEGVVHRLLRKLPEERFQSSAELFGVLDPARHAAAASGQLIAPQTVSTVAPQPFPIVSQLGRTPTGPALTTHTAAAGAVSTVQPHGGSKMPWVVGGIAIVAAASIAIAVIVTGGSRGGDPPPVVATASPSPSPSPPPPPPPQAVAQTPTPPTPAANPTPTPKPTQTIAAPKHNSKISPAHTVGSAAPTKAPDEPAPPPAPPSLGFDEAMSRARDDASAHKWAAALQHAQAALASRNDPEAQMIATKAACSLGHADLARRYAPPKSSGSYHELAARYCENAGINVE